MAKTLFDRLKFTKREWKSADERIRDSQKRARGQAAAPMLKAINAARAIAKQNKPKIEPMSAHNARINQRSKENVDAWKDTRDLEMGQHGVLKPTPRLTPAQDETRRYHTQHDDTARALGMPTKGERQTRHQLFQAKMAARETEMKGSNYPRPPEPATEPKKDLLGSVKGFLRSGKYKTRTA